MMLDSNYERSDSGINMLEGHLTAAGCYTHVRIKFGITKRGLRMTL